MLLAFFAGLLTTLSPCVLPLIPIVLTGAVAEHRLAPFALAGGLALSFTAIGLFVATIGFSMGLDLELFRKIAAALLIAVFIVLLVPRFQVQIATAASPASNWADQRFGRFSTSGVGGQFGVGLLLGAVWTACVGPTSGAASLMAARGENLGVVTVTMFAFGLGTSLPLLGLAMVSREALIRWRGRMLQAGGTMKIMLGVLLVTFGILTLTGHDRALQTALTEMAPAWLVSLTTSL